MTQGNATWCLALADFVVDCNRGDMPEGVLERAAFQLLDTIACAAGAHDADPVLIVKKVIDGSGPKEARIFFEDQRASVVDAVLSNGTAVRFLDANDIALGKGPGGHPSDNIVVGTAVAEKARSTGMELLRAIVLNYELVRKLRTISRSQTLPNYQWDGVSFSGVVAAAMTSALLGGDRVQIANAIAIGAAKGYALKEIRHGEISMLKASGNAVVAREGVLAGMLAMEGMTGPPRVFEGDFGLLKTLGGEATPRIFEALIEAPAWAIRDVSIKAFPAIGTSQAAIHAAIQIVTEHQIDARGIEKVVIRLPATKYAREYQGLYERMWPKSRESADHSIPFLVALALIEGDVTQEHYDRRRWEDPDIKELMAKVDLRPDLDLAADAETSFSSAVEVTLASGAKLGAEIAHTPGSPSRPWGRAEIVEKFRRLDRVGLSLTDIDGIADSVMVLGHAPNVTGLTDRLSALH